MFLIAPLSVKENPLYGLLITGISKEKANFFPKITEDDIDFFSTLCMQTSFSLENTYLVENMVEKERLIHEMELGRQIQIGLLKKQTPSIKNLHVSGMMIPAMEIGGDYFDFITLPDDNKYAILIGCV